MSGDFVSPYLRHPLRSEAEARGSIAPAGNETPRVLRDLKHRSRGGGTVNLPAELALQLVEAIEAGILVGAEIEAAARRGLPVQPVTITSPSDGRYAAFRRAVEALRQVRP